MGVESIMKTKGRGKIGVKAVRTGTKRPVHKRSLDEMSLKEVMAAIMRRGAELRRRGEDSGRIKELASGQGGLRPGVNLKDEIAECL